MTELEAMRKELSVIDDELAELYLMRLALCARIGLVKKTEGKEILDKAREESENKRLLEKHFDEATESEINGFLELMSIMRRMSYEVQKNA